MNYVLDLLQGLGIAAAIGIRPFLPVLLAGGLAAANAGIDFDGTSFAFLEAWPFWLAVLAVTVALTYADRRNPPDVGLLLWIGLAVAVVLGALEAAGSVDDRSSVWLPGLAGGAIAAALGYFAARSLFTRARRRLDPAAAAALPVYGEGIAALAAGLSILLPPLAVVVIAGLLWMLRGGRRREGEKYAGLRILR
jgi:Domain of unknown function (DUF4126)